MKLGYVEAIIGRFDFRDSSGELLVPGCIARPADGGDHLVMASHIDHMGTEAKRPIVGLGTLIEDGPLLIWRGRYDVHTRVGYVAHQILRHAGDSLGWSYSARVYRSHNGTHYDQPTRFITLAWFYEVSPTLWPGASYGTRTRETFPPLCPWEDYRVPAPAAPMAGSPCTGEVVA